MAPVVQKYGGSSISDVDAMRCVVRCIVTTREVGNTAVAVVSAMGGMTDELLDRAAALTIDAPAREMDTPPFAGERTSVALFAMAVSELGVLVCVYTGAQARVPTDSRYGKASVIDVLPKRVVRFIQIDSVVIIAGSQGINEVEDTTTLGRGGSNTTAITLVAALNADVCGIHIGVDDLLVADPCIAPTTRRIESFSNEETLELATHGVKTSHLRAVEYARRFGAPLHARSSFSDKTGIRIYDDCREGAFVSSVVAAQLDDAVVADTDNTPSVPSVVSPAAPQSTGAASVLPPDPAGLDEGLSASVVDTTHRNTVAARVQARSRSSAKEDHMGALITSGIARDRSQDRIAFVGTPDVLGAAARIFTIVTGANVNIDMIVQDVPAEGTGLTNISSVCPDGGSAVAREVLEAARKELGFRSLHFNPDIGTPSLVGVGIYSNPGVSTRLSGSLSETRVNIHMISVSEIRISVVVDDAVFDEAMCAAHSVFGFDVQVAEAVVCGGTGRRAIP